MALKHLTVDQKAVFNIARARGYSVTAAMKQVQSTFEGVYEYTYQTYAAYARSEEGRFDFAEALEVVRNEAKKKSYSHRGSRLDIMIEQVDKLLQMFRLETKSAPMVRLSGEIRDLFKAIREEVDPYGIQDSATLSHFEKILAGFGGLKEKQQDLIMGGTETWQSRELKPN